MLNICLIARSAQYLMKWVICWGNRFDSRATLTVCQLLVKMLHYAPHVLYICNVWISWLFWPFYQVIRQLNSLSSPGQPCCIFTLFSQRTNGSIWPNSLCTFFANVYKQSVASCINHIVNVWHILPSIHVHLYMLQLFGCSKVYIACV